MNGFFGPTEHGLPGPRGPKGDPGDLAPIRDKLNMNNFRIVNMKDPKNAQDAVTKHYMEDRTRVAENGGLDVIKGQLSLAPMQLLWSGLAVTREYYIEDLS